MKVAMLDLLISMIALRIHHQIYKIQAMTSLQK